MLLLQKMAILALGGALGTLSRYGLTGLAQNLFSDRFPWGTFLVNMLGTFLIGFGWALSEDKLLLTPGMRLLLLTGFCGAFTTYSTYILESFEIMKQGDYFIAACNIIGSVVLGLSLLIAGIALGRYI